MKHHESVRIETVKCLLKGDVTKAAEKDNPHVIVGRGARTNNNA